MVAATVPVSTIWTAAELEATRPRWTFALDDRARRDLLAALKKARDPDKTLLDYRREDFDPGAGGRARHAYARLTAEGRRQKAEG